MLFEDTLIDAVIVHLKTKGYRILRSDVTQHGYDLVAEKNGKYSNNTVEINKSNAEHLIIIIKALVNLAQELLRE